MKRACLAPGAILLALITGCSAPPEVPNRPVTIAFAGDVHLEAPFDSDDLDEELERSFAELRSADLAVINMETAVSATGTVQDKRFVFRTPPASLDRIEEFGVDVANMANNHALDFGRDGLSDTFRAIGPKHRTQSGLRVIGIGRDVAEAFAPATLTVREQRISIYGATLDDDPTADPTRHWAASKNQPGVANAHVLAPLLEQVRRSSALGHVVVVYLHWGIQGQVCPSPTQRDAAERLEEAGADVITGSHTHTVQGFGRLKSAYVGYGLGNFVWKWPSHRDRPDGGVLTVSLRNGAAEGATWLPTKRTLARPWPRAAPSKDRSVDKLRECAGLSE